MKSVRYLDAITKALSGVGVIHGDGSFDTEDIIAALAGAGFLIVEVPPGVKHDFVGVES